MVSIDSDKTNAKFNEYLEKNGYDGIEIRGTVVDSPDGLPSTQYMIPEGNEKNLRSRFAKFDPSKRNSADLLASNPGDPLSAAAALQKQFEDKQILKFLETGA
jgi:hypothetical protein